MLVPATAVLLMHVVLLLALVLVELLHRPVNLSGFFLPR